MRNAIFAIAGLLLGTVIAQANDLEPGSPAPPLSVKTWYKGTPVKAFNKNKIYVVEFWATWCGPCRHSIPHVTELASKNEDVTFIGVGVREDDDGKNIKAFVAEMGDKMNYNVGYSGNKTGMYLTWMKATGQTFIPNAYIIKSNTIQWIGHPLDMDKPLSAIKAGKFSVAKSKTEFRAVKQKAALDAAISKDREEIYALIKDLKLIEGESRIRKHSEQYPSAKVDDMLSYLKSKEIPRFEADIFETLRGPNPSLAKEMIAEFKRKYSPTEHPITSTDKMDYFLMAATDSVQLATTIKKLVAENTYESIQKVGSYYYWETQPGGNPQQAKRILDALLVNIKKEDFEKNLVLAVVFSFNKEYPKALEFIDSAIIAFPTTKYKDNLEYRDRIIKMRAVFAEKAKG